MSWVNLAQWWIDELASDPAYDEEIAPLLMRLLDPHPGDIYLDLGCGTGRVAALVAAAGGQVVGCDVNFDLLRLAKRIAPVVQSKLPELTWVRPESCNGAFVGLVLEHVQDEGAFFCQAAQAVRAGGILAMVINHPVWTAPGSAPIEDEDSEVLWRPGIYFGRGYSDEPAGTNTVRFYHRTLSDIVNAASNAGWDLQVMHELGVSQRQIERFPEYYGQQQIPRLLGARWYKR